MYKALGFLFFVVLFSCSSSQAIGQVTTRSRLANETNAPAKRLLEEGIELTGAGQLPQAVRAFEEAIKLDPQYADAYAALGRAYFKMHEWRRAVDNLHRAAALNAKQRQAVIQRQTVTQRQAANHSEAPPVVKAPPPTPKINLVTLPAVSTRRFEVSRASLALSQSEKTVGVDVLLGEPPAPPEVESKTVSPVPLKIPNADVSLTKIYRVGPGDVLDVRIDEAPQGQSTLFTVTPAGLLEHPTFAEPLSVSALTTAEIETKIQDDLKKRALSEDPKVTVGIRDYASHTVLVSGLVKDSGTKVLRREAIPLYVVVADAQPLPEAARVTVVRNELGQMFEIDLTDVAEMNLLVRPGDVVNLLPRETQFVYVGGEVKTPGEKIFRRGLTLTQAIISAGGVTPKSKVAEIGRDDGRGFLVKTSFTLQDIQTGKAMDPLIKPGDRIMVLR